MSNLAEEKKFTYRDYIKWGDDIRYEIIDGIAYAMAAPSQAHQETSRELLTQLAVYLKGKPCKAFHAPFDVRLNYDTYDDIVVQPDILVVCDESKLDGQSVTGAPEFIIEILSPKNTRYDTEIKFRKYQQAGVKEYWIVDPIARDVDVYILRGGVYGKGTVYRDGDIIPVNILPGCRIDLSDIFYDIDPGIETEDTEPDIKYKIISALKNKKISKQQLQKIIDDIDN